MKEKCLHCNLKFDDLISDEFGNKFCCNGCLQVYHLLNDKGLDEFYARLGKNTLSPVSNITKTTSENTKSIYKNYVKTTADGLNEIFIIIDGIHCSACVWLIEKVLHNAKGVLEATINTATNKAKIVWDEDETNLAQIFNLISSIGYSSYPYDPARSEVRFAAKRRKFYSKLLIGIFATMNAMWMAVALYGGYFTGMEASTKDLLHFVEFILATLVLFYVGTDFFKGAKTAIKTKTPNMDLLVVSGAMTSYLYSIYAMFARSGEVYFEAVCMIITFVFAGKFLEVVTKKRAVDSLDTLSNFVLDDVMVKRGSSFVLTPPNAVKQGDIILTNSGEKVLIDGVIKSGFASFDYASLSGESVPVFKEKGETISSGAVCIDGSVEYEASGSFENSLLSKIINLLENAPLKKSRIEELSTEISGHFSSVILVLGLLSFVAWFLLTLNLERSLVVGITVLIVACPCALGLATPVATLVGLNSALKVGVIFKEARVIETMSKCKTIIFDKTGTLTKAKLKVESSEISPNCDLNLLANLLKNSNHPVSVAVLESLNFSPKSVEFDEFSEVVAKGVMAKIGKDRLAGGSVKFMNELGLSLAKSEKTSYFFAKNSEILAKFELSDEIKDGTKDSIDELKKQGFRVVMLSGDSKNAVKKVADELGIDEYKFELSPLEKAEFVSKESEAIMVGDGINDANALSLAAVGIAIGSGANVSVDRSDVVLINDTLSSLVNAVLISKRTLTTIKQNLGISFFYNAITIPVAMAGYMLPMIAAISMSLSSIVVVANSLRRKGVR